MTNVNPIATPVLNSPDDQPIGPNVYDGPTSKDYANPTRLTFAPETIIPYERNRRAANDDGEVTAIHGNTNRSRGRTGNAGTPPSCVRRSPRAHYEVTTGSDRRISASVVSELTKRLAQTDERVDDELATLRARLVKTETLLRGLLDHPVAPPPAPVEIESVHTNTDYRRNSPRTAPTTTLPMAQPVAPIALKPFTFDALTKFHTQLPTTHESRPTQVPRAHTVPVVQRHLGDSNPLGCIKIPTENR